MDRNAMEIDGEVRQMIENTKKLIFCNGVNRSSLSLILEGLVAVAHRRDLWSENNYPAPRHDENQVRYLIHEEPDQTYALYLNVMRPGKVIPPHNHTTWACVAAVVGEEHNDLYRRIDGSTCAGLATLEKEKSVVVRPGLGVALMPEDIHSVEIKGNEIIRHLHMYGRALETLSERLSYDIAGGTCNVMNIGVSSRKTTAENR